VLDLSSPWGYWAEHAATVASVPVDCQNASEWKRFLVVGRIREKTKHLQENDRFRWVWSSFKNPTNFAQSEYDLVISDNHYHDLYESELDK
jgi:hypothetical protein